MLPVNHADLCLVTLMFHRGISESKHVWCFTLITLHVLDLNTANHCEYLIVTLNVAILRSAKFKLSIMVLSLRF